MAKDCGYIEIEYHQRKNGDRYRIVCVLFDRHGNGDYNFMNVHEALKLNKKEYMDNARKYKGIIKTHREILLNSNIKMPKKYYIEFRTYEDALQFVGEYIEPYLVMQKLTGGIVNIGIETMLV